MYLNENVGDNTEEVVWNYTLKKEKPNREAF